MSDMENLKIIRDLQDKMNEVLDSFDEIKQDLNGLKLNEQRYLVSNMPIPPGIACKFAYDSKGLILSASQLVESDIPELDIDHIKGLRTLLNGKISDSELERLQIRINNDIPKRSNKVEGSGCKVNYDKYGFIVSVGDLSKDDIPLLPIEKIDGLQDKLTFIESSIKQHTDQVDEFKVTPGVGCKVTYDSKGRIMSSAGLDMNDIPMAIINHLNEIDSKMINFAQSSTVNGILDTLGHKLDANPNIKSGSYTKVTVDENGLVTKGDTLRKEDLPSLSIDDIVGLKNSLRLKADQTDIIKLNENVSSIMGLVNSIGDIRGMQNLLESKADSSEVTSLSNTLNSLRDTVLNYIQNTHSDTFEDTIRQIQQELSTLSGRISVLERKNKI